MFLVAQALGGAVVETHAALDWSAPIRWVHVDNVDSARTRVFEEARLGWLKALRRGDRLLGDGRPLFWHARSGAVQTFFTFYPLDSLSDLDKRRDMIRRSEATVGQAAVERYDAGDVALVAPHYTQIWRRSPEDDFSTLETKDLTELSAAFGRLDIRQVDPRNGARVDELWRQIRDTLAAAKYPLSCRVFSSTYGSGDLVFMWLAHDSKTLQSAPSIQATTAQQLGQQRSAALLEEWNRLVIEARTLSVERRLDLSNLGQ